MEYKNKDIVFVNNYKYKNGSSGKNHNFVIVDDNKAIDINYFGFLLSSKTNKTGQKFPYNILLPKNETNNLKYDSIVKCDDLITKDKNEIEFKIGEVSDEDLKEFKSLYKQYMDIKNAINDSKNATKLNVPNENQTLKQ